MIERSALFLGYLSGASTGSYASISEGVMQRLPDLGWQVLGASARANRALRLLDVLFTIWAQRHRCDVAHVDVFSGLAFIQAEWSVRALRRLGKPFVLTLRGGNLPAFAARHPDRVRRLLQSAAAVTAPSGYLRDALRPFRGDIHLIPNAVELHSYTYRLRSAPAPRLLWLRAMAHVYNPVLAVRVVDRLRRAHPDVHLWMVGPDKGDGTLERVRTAIRDLGVQDHIEIVGGVPKADVPRWMDKADILINTTNVDNTPVSIIEALASGLCVVTTNVGGIPALVQDGLDALLVPPDDPQAMADAVERILTTPDLAAQLSRQAHENASAFDWPRVLTQWDDLLRRVASGGTSAAG